jgi:outer membrane receptor protein involved in Fe transport
VIRRRHVLGALAAGLLAGAAGVGAATPSGETTPAVAELVVTGSHIPRAAEESVSPITTIDRAAVAATGLVRAEDVIARLPQAYVGQNADVTNAATGTATIDLRQLGPERTLVLLDGKRLMPGDPTSGSVAPDLNFVPTALIRRVDVVTGGASAVYGSDAIAGVVNIQLDDELQGVRLDAHGGFYDHVNGDLTDEALVAAHGFSLPARQVDDGATWSLDFAAGARSGDGRGALTLYAGYREAAALPESQRDFSACGLADAGDAHACMGSTRAPALGAFQPLHKASLRRVGGALTLDAAGPDGALRPLDQLRDGFNNAPFQYFQRPDARWTAGAFADWRAAELADFYAQAMFMDDETTAQLAPSGLFGVRTQIACSSPLLSAAEVDAFCTAAGYGPGDLATLQIARRNVEGGPRRYALGHRDWRTVAGVKGAAGGWTYDASLTWSSVRMRTEIQNEVSISRAIDALDVVSDGAGALGCASGDPGCAPYDIFRVSGVTPAALQYLSVPTHAAGATGELVLSLVASGDLGAYGLKSPWADTGLSVAFGAEHRRESLSYAPDAELASGDLASSVVAEPPVSGAFHVSEVYAEARWPLVERRGPWLDELAVEGGVRFSRYSAAGPVWAYKAGAEWGPLPGVRLRSSYNHAVRAPTVVDLFTPQTVAGGLDNDPCAGPDPAAVDPLATPANCARTGVPADLYGSIDTSPDTYNSLVGGNPRLRPESADTFTAGLVLTPPRAPRLSLTLDWFDIEIGQALGVIGADAVVRGCLSSGSPMFCALIHRAPYTGSLWLGQGYVIDTVENTAELGASGVDVEARYRRDLPRAGGRTMGEVSLDLVGAFVISRRKQSDPTAPLFECAGLYGDICGQPAPRWRHVLSLDWSTPWRADLGLAWRYVAPVTLDLATANPALAGPFSAADRRLPAFNYLDLSAAWRVRPGVTIRAGANNLLDQDPPVVPAAFGNGNTIPGLYDALGRFVFVGFSASVR